MRYYVSIINVKTHWGFSVRTYPASATQTSYTVPPPTSIIGSLACAHSALKNNHREYTWEDQLPEGLPPKFLKEDREYMWEDQKQFYSYVAEFVDNFNIVYATACILSELRTSTLQTIRYFTMPYQAPEKDVETFSKHLKVSEMFAPIQLGYVVYDQLALIIISGKEIPTNVLWSVTRLGSKESIISVSNVTKKEVKLKKVSKGEYVKVNTYVPLDLGVVEAPSSFVMEKIPFPTTKDDWISWFSFRKQKVIEKTVVIPLPPVNVNFKILKDCYEVSLNGYTIVLPHI